MARISPQCYCVPDSVLRLACMNRLHAVTEEAEVLSRVTDGVMQVVDGKNRNELPAFCILQCQIRGEEFK